MTTTHGVATGPARTWPARIRAIVLAAAVLIVSSCSNQHEGHQLSPATGGASGGVSTSEQAGAGHDHGDDHGGDQGGPGHGVLDAQDGYSLQLIQTPTTAGQAGVVAFRIAGPTGAPQTRFQLEQEKLMHVYVVRRDLADFYHVHPDIAADGTWSAPLTVRRPGPYRVVSEFVALDEQDQPHHLVLGTDFEVPGPYTAEPLPAPTPDIQSDGYDVALEGDPVADQPSMLTLRITKNGSPVVNLEPYLGTAAHLTAFHEGDLQVVHMHPTSPPPGASPADSAPMVHAEFPAKGLYRVFIQFQTDGQLHVAPVTIVAK